MPWCARDGVRWTFPAGGSKSFEGRDPLLNGGRSLPSRNRRLGGGGTIRIKKSKCARCPVRFEWDHQQARDLAKNKIVQLERALEAMGGMEGPAVQAIKLELEKATTTSKKPQLNVEIEEARKFITRSMRRLKEMEEERQVEERLLSEAQENLKDDVGGAGEGSQPPSTVTGRNFTDNRPPTDGEHVAGRTTVWWRSCNLAGGCGEWRSCTLHRVQKRQPRTSENEQPKGKRVVQRTSRIPSRS